MWQYFIGKWRSTYLKEGIIEYSIENLKFIQENYDEFADLRGDYMG